MNEKKINVEVDTRAVYPDNVAFRLQVALHENDHADILNFRVPNIPFNIKIGSNKVVSGISDSMTGVLETDEVFMRPHDPDVDIEIEARDGVEKIRHSLKVNVSKLLEELENKRREEAEAFKKGEYEDKLEELHKADRLREVKETVIRAKNRFIDNHQFIGSPSYHDHPIHIFVLHSSHPSVVGSLLEVADKAPARLIASIGLFYAQPWAKRVVMEIAKRHPAVAIDHIQMYEYQPWAGEVANEATSKDPCCALEKFDLYKEQPWAEALEEKALKELIQRCSDGILLDKINEKNLKTVIEYYYRAPQDLRILISGLILEITLKFPMYFSEHASILNRIPSDLLRIIDEADSKMKSPIGIIKGFIGTRVGKILTAVGTITAVAAIGISYKYFSDDDNSKTPIPVATRTASPDTDAHKGLGKDAESMSDATDAGTLEVHTQVDPAERQRQIKTEVNKIRKELFWIAEHVNSKNEYGNLIDQIKLIKKYDHPLVKDTMINFAEKFPKLADDLLEHYVEMPWAEDVVNSIIFLRPYVIDKFPLFKDRPWAKSIVLKIVNLHKEDYVAGRFPLYSQCDWAKDVISVIAKKYPQSFFSYIENYEYQPWAKDLAMEAASHDPSSAIENFGKYKYQPWGSEVLSYSKSRLSLK